MFDYSKLRGRIVEKFGTLSEFSEHLHISRVSMNNKLNETTKFTRDDILEWSELLEIKPEEYAAYFFVTKVDNV